MAEDKEAAQKWADYYSRTQAFEPRKTLLMALDNFAAEEAGRGAAVDLGCGGGRDSVEMLRRGWSVLAVDRQQAAIEHLLARDDLPKSGKLDTLVSSFETASWPTVDLVNSSFALPLCPQAEFPGFWARIIASLRGGGRFSGHLYGDNDDWAGDPTNSHFTRAEVEEMLTPFEVEYFEEEEDDSTTPRGTAKHWHVFHIVARKRGDA